MFSMISCMWPFNDKTYFMLLLLLCYQNVIKTLNTLKYDKHCYQYIQKNKLFSV